MSTKTKKGASTLQLDNAELRRELIYADIIIEHTLSGLSLRDQKMVARMNGIYSRTDPFRVEARKQAMHRITPKIDYVKLAFFVLSLALMVAFVSSQADNQRLRTQLSQVQGE